jgi:hypothetical protein
MLKYNSQLADRKAFYQYLDDAPKIEDPKIPNECADVREYFEYDRDFPDDDRICKEVKELQCFDEFSNLDGFATGTSNGVGEGDGEDQPLLFMSTKLVTNTKGKSAFSLNRVALLFCETGTGMRCFSRSPFILL